MNIVTDSAAILVKKPKAIQIPPKNSVNAIKYAKKKPVINGFEYSLSRKLIKPSNSPFHPFFNFCYDL